jgi:hypothetical protein
MQAEIARIPGESSAAPAEKKKGHPPTPMETEQGMLNDPVFTDQALLH